MPQFLTYIVALVPKLVEYFTKEPGGISTGQRIDLVEEFSLKLLDLIDGLASFLGAILGDEMGAWQFSHPQIVGGAWGLGETSYNVMAAMQRLTDVIIPNSLRWLDGETHRWVDATFDWQLADYWAFKQWQQKWDQITTNWANNYADPLLASWLAWRTFLLGWPLASWTILHDWLEHPATFGEWAAAPVIGPIVAYLADPGHQLTRDNLTAILVDATPDVWRHVEQAATAILLTEQ